MSEKTPLNPSAKATARVKNPLPVPEKCNCCGGAVRLAKHDEVYAGGNYGDWPWMYLCTECKAYVGLHPFTAIPLGTLADALTRNARKNCKPAFNRIWQHKNMTRTEAYSWLAEQLGIPAEECHFGWFNREQCEKAKAICENYRGYRK